ITDNQDYLAETIKVYEAKVEINGEGKFVTVKGDEVDASEYDLTVNDNSFTVKWENDTESAYIVEYSTLFFEKDGETVSNDYKITGDGIEETDDDASGSGSVKVKQLSSGGATGEAGYLVVQKLDTTHGETEKPIEGIEFELIDKDTGNVLKTGTTDAEGNIDFGRLLFGEYELKEVNTPDGYVGLGTETIKIEKVYKNSDDSTITVYEVENYKPNYSIGILKTDEGDEALEGAEFTLFKENGDEVETKTTDADGKITFNKVEP